MTRYVAAALLYAFVLMPAYGQQPASEVSYAPQPARSVEGGEQDFGSRLLLVSTKAGGKDSVTYDLILVAARIRKLGDRFYLVGQSIDAESTQKQAKRPVTWLALSEIVSIAEYENLQAYKKVLEEEEKNRRSEVEGGPVYSGPLPASLTPSGPTPPWTTSPAPLPAPR